MLPRHRIGYTGGRGVCQYQHGGCECSQVQTTMHTRKCIPIAEPCSLPIDTQQTYGSNDANITDSGPEETSRANLSRFRTKLRVLHPQIPASQMAYSTYPDGVHHGAVPEGQTDASGHYMQQQEYGSGQQHQEQTQNERTDGGNEPPQPWQRTGWRERTSSQRRRQEENLRRVSHAQKSAYRTG